MKDPLKAGHDVHIGPYRRIHHSLASGWLQGNDAHGQEAEFHSQDQTVIKKAPISVGLNSYTQKINVQKKCNKNFQ